MAQVHSPLPPAMPPTLETIDGKLTHVITVVEVTSDRVERLEDDRERLHRVERSLQRMIGRVSTAALQVSARLVVASAVPPMRSLFVMGGGAFLGGAAATFAIRLLVGH